MNSMARLRERFVAVVHAGPLPAFLSLHHIVPLAARCDQRARKAGQRRATGQRRASGEGEHHGFVLSGVCAAAFALVGAARAYHEAQISVLTQALVLEKGNMLMAKGDWAGAARAYNEAREVQKDLGARKAAIRRAYLMLYNNHGALLLDQGDTAGARDSFLKALEIDPDFEFVVHLDVCRQLQSSGDIAGAQAAYRRAEAMCRCALDINPRHAAMHLTLSYVLEESGDLLGAVKAAEDYAREEKMRTLEGRIEIAQGAKNKIKERYTQKEMLERIKQMVIAAAAEHAAARAADRRGDELFNTGDVVGALCEWIKAGIFEGLPNTLKRREALGVRRRKALDVRIMMLVPQYAMRFLDESYDACVAFAICQQLMIPILGRHFNLDPARFLLWIVVMPAGFSCGMQTACGRVYDKEFLDSKDIIEGCNNIELCKY